MTCTPCERRTRGRPHTWGAALCAVTAACACSGATAAPADHDGGAHGSDAGAPPALSPSRIPADFRCDPTLESIRNGIFVTSCAFDYCHGDNAYVYELRLTADVTALSTELVGAAAKSCSGWTRVVPGDVEHSLLWNKITEEKPACGVRMPYGTEPLPQSALDCVRGWIESL